MKIKIRLISLLTATCLLVSSLMVIFPYGFFSAHASSQALYGGFLYPFRDEINRSDDDMMLIQNIHAGQAIDFATVARPHGEFDVLAPKDGYLIDFEDRFPNTQGVSNCTITPDGSYRDFPN